MSIKQIEPQPARGTLKPEMWDSPNYWAERKFNGCRELAHFEPDRVYFTSRVVSKKTGEYTEKGLNVPHINKAVPELVGTVLDGEMIFAHGVTEKVTEVMTIMGSLPEEAIKKQDEIGYVTYRVFDVIYLNGEYVGDKPLFERRKILEDIHAKYLASNKNIILPKIVRTGKRKFYERMIKAGAEGIMLKDINHKYGEKRGWIKAKRVETYDVIITGYDPPKQFSTKVDGTYGETRFYKMGWIGALQIGVWKDGELVYVGRCSGFSDDMRKEFSENKEKYLGVAIELDCQEVHPSGFYQNPRFIRLRPDKNLAQCEWQGKPEWLTKKGNKLEPVAADVRAIVEKRME